MVGILSSLCLSLLYGNGFLSRGFTDRQFGEISERSSPVLGDSPRDGRILGVNMRGSIFGALRQPIKYRE